MSADSNELSSGQLSLVIETSGRIGSVALAVGEQLLEERHFEHGLMHAAGMVPMIEGLLSARGRSAGDVHRIFISSGPGSFTGLRIGITLAKTLALVTGAEIIPVPTLRILAENAAAVAHHLIVLLDAKRGQVYAARYQRDNAGWVEVEPAHLDTLSAMISRAPRPVYLLGEGLAYHQSSIPAQDDSIIQTAADNWQARASAVIRVGIPLARLGHHADPDTLEPLYIRPPEAEEKWASANL